MPFNFNHIHLMKHALGNPDPRSKKELHRNYYAANPRSEQAKLWEELVELGYAFESVSEPPSSLRYFHVTRRGREVLGCPF